MGYALGWSITNRLRPGTETTRQQFSLYAFHDKPLSSGSISLPLVEKRCFAGLTFTQRSQRKINED